MWGATTKARNTGTRRLSASFHVSLRRDGESSSLNFVHSIASRTCSRFEGPTTTTTKTNQTEQRRASWSLSGFCISSSLSTLAGKRAASTTSELSAQHPCDVPVPEHNSETLTPRPGSAFRDDLLLSLCYFCRRGVFSWKTLAKRSRHAYPRRTHSRDCY